MSASLVSSEASLLGLAGDCLLSVSSYGPLSVAHTCGVLFSLPNFQFL